MQYDQKSRRPKLLPCNHTFCKLCVHEFGNDFECPVCRRTISVLPGEAMAFPTNFALLDQTLALNQQTVVDDDIIVPKEGKHEPDYSAYNNQSASCVSPESQKGNIGTSCEIKESDPTQQSQVLNTSCSNDNTPMNSDDNECSDETMSKVKEQLSTSSSKGQIHKESFDSHTTEGASIDIDNLFDEAVGLASEKHSSLSTEMKLLEECKNNVITDIDQTFDKLISVINRRRHLLKNQVSDLFSEKQNALEETMDGVSLSLLCLDKLRQHTSKHVNGITAMQTTVVSEIKDLCESVNESSVSSNEIGFDKNIGLDQFTSLVRQIGKVKCTGTLPSEISLHPSHPDIFSVGSKCTVGITVYDFNKKELIHPFDDLSIDLIDCSGEKVPYDLVGSSLTFTPTVAGEFEWSVTFRDILLPVNNSVTTVIDKQ